MKKILLSLMIIAAPMWMAAQDHAVLDAIKQVGSSTTSIVSRLQQDKYVALLETTVSSTASFQYAPGLMAIHYDEPAGDCFVINDMQVMMVTKGKRRVMSAKNGTAKMMRIMLLAAMTGDYHEAEEYMTKMNVDELDDCHIVEVELDDEKARGGISKVEARYDKGTKRIGTIMMHYTNGDYTSYTLTEVRVGAQLDSSLFAIKK